MLNGTPSVVIHRIFGLSGLLRGIILGNPAVERAGFLITEEAIGTPKGIPKARLPSLFNASLRDMELRLSVMFRICLKPSFRVCSCLPRISHLIIALMGEVLYFPTL